MRKRISMGLTALLAAGFLALALSCSASPVSSGNSSGSGSPSWQTVFSDFFTGAGPSLLWGTNWTGVLTNGPETNTYITNNEILFLTTAVTNGDMPVIAAYSSPVGSGKIRITLKVKSENGFGLGARAVLSPSIDAGYMAWISPKYPVLYLSTNGEAPVASTGTNAIFTVTNDYCYMEFIVDSYAMTCNMYGLPATNLIATVSYTDSVRLLTNGSVWIAGMSNTVMDDFKIEKFE